MASPDRFAGNARHGGPGVPWFCGGERGASTKLLWVYSSSLGELNGAPGWKAYLNSTGSNCQNMDGGYGWSTLYDRADDRSYTSWSINVLGCGLSQTRQVAADTWNAIGGPNRTHAPGRL